MEDKILKPNEVSPNLLKRLENKYGDIDVVNDFFNSDLIKSLFSNDVLRQDSAIEKAEFTLLLKEVFNYQTLLIMKK